MNLVPIKMKYQIMHARLQSAEHVINLTPIPAWKNNSDNSEIYQKKREWRK